MFEFFILFSCYIRTFFHIYSFSSIKLIATYLDFQQLKFNSENVFYFTFIWFFRSIWFFKLYYNMNNLKFAMRYSVRPFLISFLFPSWRAVRSYRPHLEERDPVWGNDWSHSPFIWRSSSGGFLGFSSAVRQMPGNLCTAPRIISLSPYH